MRWRVSDNPPYNAAEYERLVAGDSHKGPGRRSTGPALRSCLRSADYEETGPAEVAAGSSPGDGVPPGQPGSTGPPGNRPGSAGTARVFSQCSHPEAADKLFHAFRLLVPSVVSDAWGTEFVYRGLPRRYFGPVMPGLDLAATWGFTRPEVVLPGAISTTDLAWMRSLPVSGPGGHGRNDRFE